MNIESIENQKLVKLLKFAIEERNFSANQAVSQCNMGISEFYDIWESIFIKTPAFENGFDCSRSYDWILKPEALFSYMNFLEYRDSLTNARRAYWVAIASIVISTATVLLSFVG